MRDPATILLRARQVTAGGLLACFLIAPRLWLGLPLFAPIPAAAGLTSPPPAVLALVYAALVALLLPLLVLRRAPRLAAAWLALFLARVLWDRATWQPYLLQYAFTLGVVAAAERAPEERRAQALDALRLMLALIYFWSGLAKLDRLFLTSWVTGLFPPLGRLPPALVPAAALVVPVAETGLALGLFVPRLRRAAVALALAMHAIILATIGPLGLSYNPVVWPWNVAQAALLLLLFGRGALPEAPLRARAGSRPAAAALAVFGLLPLLAEAGLWSPYLSFRLYSPRFHLGSAWVTERVVERLPGRARAELQRAAAGRYAGYLSILYWSEHEMRAFAPPEPPVYRHVAREMCRHAPEPWEVLLVIEDPPGRLDGRRGHRVLDCDQLGPG